MADDEAYYWQPVMLVSERRIECGLCRAAAIFIVLDQDGEDDLGYTAWCRHCWEREQREAERCETR